jgi:hypothetical protein
MAKKKKLNKFQRTKQGFEAAGAGQEAILKSQVADLLGAPGANSGPEPPNRYNDRKTKLAQNATFGTSLNEIINVTSEGEHDFAQLVRKTIALEYTDFWHYLNGLLGGFVTGLFFVTMFYELGVLDINQIEFSPFAVGIAGIVGFLFALYFRRMIRRNRVCQKVKGVDHHHIGKHCLAPSDCSTLPEQMLRPNMCARKAMGLVSSMMRWISLLGLLGAGAFFLATGIGEEDGYKVGFRQQFFFLVLGMFIAFFSMFVFS